MGYLDTTDAEIFALTRLRRAEAKARRIAALPEPVRYSKRERDIHAVRAWREAQWSAGVRCCGYCGGGMQHAHGRPDSITVDHREPWALGGADDPSNWIVACYTCNQAKGEMAEAEFRGLLAVRLTA